MVEQRTVTLKCKLECYVKPMKDLALALLKGIMEPQKERKFVLTSVGIEPTISGLDLPLLCRLSYEVGQRKSGTIYVVNRGEVKVRVHMYVVPLSIHYEHK